MVVMQTSLGTLRLEVFTETAPETAANFLQYVRAGFYDGTIFHRVIPGFVVQGGGFDESYRQKPTRGAIGNESDNGLDNARGALSMARTPDPDSATSQFFINLADNGALDAAPGRPGYAVFAEVVEGMDVVDRIAAIPTTAAGPFTQDVPQETVRIDAAEVLA